MRRHPDRLKVEINIHGSDEQKRNFRKQNLRLEVRDSANKSIYNEKIHIGDSRGRGEINLK
jgi:hypothetical protein